MGSLIQGVKKFSFPMFFVFVFSKLLVGVGLGVLLSAYLVSYGWWLLIVGVILSLFCVVRALRAD